MKTLHDQLEAEREYQFGRTEKIPGTNINVVDARIEYEKKVEKYEEGINKKREEFLKTQEVYDPVHTTSIADGIIVNLHRDPLGEKKEPKIVASSPATAPVVVVPKST